MMLFIMFYDKKDDRNQNGFPVKKKLVRSNSVLVWKWMRLRIHHYVAAPFLHLLKLNSLSARLTLFCKARFFLSVLFLHGCRQNLFRIENLNLNNISKVRQKKYVRIYVPCRPVGVWSALDLRSFVSYGSASDVPNKPLPLYKVHKRAT